VILASLLLAASAPATAIDAERAFAADAQKEGQWTAFRKWADPTAVMYTPQAVWAHEFLKDRKDPPHSVQWWPALSLTSCDGRTAVNTGPWRNEANQTDGYFTTLWMRQPSGDWRWTVDGGDVVKTPLARPARPKVRRASCKKSRGFAEAVAKIHANPANRTAPPGDYGFSRSADGTLLYYWLVRKDGARFTRVSLWNGREFDTALRQEVAAPPSSRPAP
jgi:hypothetical protein